jgi:hypothetical protein
MSFDKMRKIVLMAYRYRNTRKPKLVLLLYWSSSEIQQMPVKKGAEQQELIILSTI